MSVTYDTVCIGTTANAPFSILRLPPPERKHDFTLTVCSDGSDSLQRAAGAQPPWAWQPRPGWARGTRGPRVGEKHNKQHEQLQDSVV